MDLEGLNSDETEEDKVQTDDTDEPRSQLDISKMEYKDRMNYFLNSPEMLTYVEMYGVSVLEVALQYLALFKDGDRLYEFIEELSGYGEKNYCSMPRWRSHDLMIKYVAKKIGLTETESEEAKEKIKEFFVREYILNGYHYHIFNGAWEHMIEEHGLDPNLRMQNKKQMDEVEAIFHKYGQSYPFGGFYLHDRASVSLSCNTESVYDYARVSPEWFEQFTGGDDAYRSRDYERAKQNVENKIKWCDGITLEERIKILQFFDDCWKKFAIPHNPKCALVKNAAVSEIDENILTDHSSIFLFWDFGRSKRIDRKIDPKNITIIDLPYFDV